MIIYPEKFQQMRPFGFSGKFDWDFILPVFSGTKIQPMDIDFIVERHGKFLVIETKSSDGVKLPLGQQILFDNLLRMGSGDITLFILPAKDEHSIWHWEEVYMLPKKNIIHSREIIGNKNDFVGRVSQWFEWANTSQFTRDNWRSGK